MSQNQFESGEVTTERTGAAPVMIALLVVVACLVGATLYLYLELQDVRAAMQPQLEMVQVHEEKLAQLEGSVTRTSREVNKSVEEFKGLVDSTEKQLSAKAAQVEQKVLGTTKKLSQEIEQTRAQQKQQKAAITEVGGKIENLQVATGSKFENVTGRVDTVEEEITKTQAELKKTIDDLTSVRGDLGVQSGLIATNATELNVLRELGERNYFEFDIRKSKNTSRVGPISIRLRKADQKRNKYNIDVWADDKKIEKKNKTLLEPVQFYVIGSRTPYELVVNQVDKNRIVGYLATPKVEKPRGGAQASGSE